MTRLAHLSDLHFGKTDALLIEPLRDELLRAAPDLVVVSGDLTLAARNREFAEAATFLRDLPAPCFVVPGNHDIPSYQAMERFIDPFRRWRRHIGPDMEPVLVNERVALVGLNSVRRASWRLNWSHGRIGRRQLARLEQRLAALPDGPVRVVVGHHPFFAPEPLLQNRVLRRSDQALTVFRRTNVRLVLAGHLHRAFIHELPGAQPGRPMLVVHGGTSISTRLRGEANAFNLIDIDDDGGLRVEGRVWTGDRWITQAAPILSRQRDAGAG
ncbi:MAG TPA: metallophosphoesterase [Thalassobaculum sp.]